MVVANVQPILTDMCCSGVACGASTALSPVPGHSTPVPGPIPSVHRTEWAVVTLPSDIVSHWPTIGMPQQDLTYLTRYPAFQCTMRARCWGTLHREQFEAQFDDLSLSSPSPPHASDTSLLLYLTQESIPIQRQGGKSKKDTKLPLRQPKRTPKHKNDASSKTRTQKDQPPSAPDDASQSQRGDSWQENPGRKFHVPRSQHWQFAVLVNHMKLLEAILQHCSIPRERYSDTAALLHRTAMGALKVSELEKKLVDSGLTLSPLALVSLDQLTADATNLVPPVQKTLNCSKHPTKELEIYCETCKEVICRDCILKVHRDHQYDLATDVFPQQKKVLVSSVEPVEQQLASVNKALEDLKSLSGEITSQRQALETQIRAEIRLGHQALEAREEVLVSQLDQMTREKLKNVAAQQYQLELVATRLKSCYGFLQESLRTGSQVEILAMAKPFVQQVQDVTSSFKPESLEPEEQADLEFNCSQNELLQMCQQYGQVIANPVAKCSAEGDGLKLAVVGERTTATVEVVDQEGRKYSRPVEVSCELVSSDGSRRVRGEAKKVRDGEYEISYLPQHRGPHYLHIRVGDKHISGSPFPLSVITTTPTNIITGVKGPWGLALDNKGQLVVVEMIGHCVTIFSGSGEKVRSFGSQGLWSRSAE
ncbi:E3 ubiquitin-protein ligase TRIM71 [Geodia barretti]|uniref:E3 ubiquitin-protein ligase TRIM71 n=1 Tax=Geodia barretti TaxID=519541 RepID=A0AA35XA99_GEOBA|nr:E3 ubiquitin-protein ligase TRIM71 [Geodia barretti]